MAFAPAQRTEITISQVNLAAHQFAQPQMMGQRDRQDQPRIGHQTVIVKGDMDAVGRSGGSIHGVLLVSRGWSFHEPLSPKRGSATVLVLQSQIR